jgi:thymidylate synthase
MQVNQDYIDLVSEIIDTGHVINCRGYRTCEVMNQQTMINMNQPLITLTGRKLGYKFACAEAGWVLEGDNRVMSIEPYSKIIKGFSDDGCFFFGAYGPKIIDQLEYIGRCFKNDLMSRQAVINIWREKPPVSKDIPCTLNIQFIIRPEKDVKSYKLFATVNMRSSDIWLGVPYDWFTFSMISAYVALYLRKILNMKNLYLGLLINNAGSRHLYEDAFGYTVEHLVELINTKDMLLDFTYNPLNLDEFEDEDDLIMHLYSLARDKVCYKNITFLKELETWWSKK